jgi:PAS domain S-box-containing protein
LTEEFEVAKLKRAEDDCLPQLIWKADLKGNAFSLNKKFLEYTGIPEDEVETSNVMDPKIVHPEDLTAYKTAFAGGNSNKDSFEVKGRLLGKDGNYKWMLTRASPIIGDDGEITFWCGSCTDIDDMVRIQVCFFLNFNRINIDGARCLA